MEDSAGKPTVGHQGTELGHLSRPLTMLASFAIFDCDICKVRAIICKEDWGLEYRLPNKEKQYPVSNTVHKISTCSEINFSNLLI